jgi:hypothetical protein
MRVLCFTQVELRVYRTSEYKTRTMVDMVQGYLKLSKAVKCIAKA